jgi:hypothetical protein
MAYRIWACFLVLCAGASVMSCSPDDEAEPVAIDGLAARYADIYCGGIEPCCKAASLAFEPQSCREKMRTYLQTQINDLLTKQIGYDEQASGECLAAFAEQSSCGDEDTIGDDNACERVFYGLLGTGAACESGEECKDEGGGKKGYCDRPFDATTNTSGPGVCKQRQEIALKHGKQGDACEQTCGLNSSCNTTIYPDDVSDAAPTPFPGDGVGCLQADNLYCGPLRTCQALKTLGQPCDGYDSCASGSFCDMDSELCVAPRANGEKCNGSSECQSERCDFELSVCVANQVTADQCSVVIEDDE